MSVSAGPLGIDQVSPDEALYGPEMTQIKGVAERATLDLLDKDSLSWVRKDELQSAGLHLLQDKPEEPPAKTDVGDKPVGDNYVIFVSWSLGEDAIKAMMKEYHQSKLVTLMFRGIPEGATMAQAMAKIQKLSVETKSDVAIELNPVTFTENSITQVPAIAKRFDEKVTSVVRGTASIEVFKDKPGTKDLGLVGAVVDIAERDLIELMQERFAKLDTDALKKKAIGRFWANQQFQTLEPASESRVRRLDPTIVIPDDMRGHNGELIHAAGTKINPLDIRPFMQRLVVIDPSDEWQLALARDQIDRFGKNQLVTIILTSVARDKGWDQLKEIEELLGQAAYMLPPDVKVRFDLQVAPSLVTADKSHFYIEEVAQKYIE